MRAFSSPAHLALTHRPQNGSVDSSRAPLPPVDEALPGYGELFAPRPQPVVAFFADAGSSIESIARVQAAWRPDRSLLVRYRVRASDGSLEGIRDVVAGTGDVPTGDVLVESADAAVSMWLLPHDPLLPGLRSAMDVAAVRSLLNGFGAACEEVSARLRAYRPGRRAVVQVDAGDVSLFLKVVPPTEVVELHKRHRRLFEHVAIPDSLGVARDLGIVVLGRLPGVDLRRTLLEGERSIPDPGHVAGMVMNLPEPDPAWRSSSPVETLPRIGELLCRLVPSEAQRIAALVEDIGSGPTDLRIPVHGDFHEAQVMVDHGHPVGLLDVDTYGWGRPGDDAATMLGHLHLLAERRHRRVAPFARGLNRLWDDRIDPVELRLSTAAVILGLATGPFRVQRRQWRGETIARIRIAEQWVQSAHRIDEKSLIPSSAASHHRFRS